MTAPLNKPKVATVWLDGCSGCHMSFLDLDERLVTLASLVDIVYSPVVDPKEFPQHVDLTLVEGAVSSEEDFHKANLIRRCSSVVIAFGDCSVTANVPGMRNTWEPRALLDAAYVEKATSPAEAANRKARIPLKVVSPLRAQAVPLHEVIPVDVFIPGCPPPADAIWQVLTELLAGKTPDICAVTRFGR